MSKNTINVEKLVSFLGYGNPAADYWFIGIEEGLDDKVANDCLNGNCNNLIEQLIVRSKFKNVMDLKDAHKLLGIEKYFRENRPPLQRTWEGIIKLILDQLPVSSTDLHAYANYKESLRTFQKKNLGSVDGNMFLAELFPLPYPRVHGSYSGLYKFLSDSRNSQFIDNSSSKSALNIIADKSDYLSWIKEDRILGLKRLIKENKPKVVVCYGKTQWHLYKEVFSDITSWEKPKTGSPFERGSFESTKVVLTPHLVAREMNGKWPELWKFIR